jgi:transposase-like protein
VRDQIHGGEKIVFQYTVLPRYLRKVDEVTGLIPFFYLKGISITEIPEVFRKMNGKDVTGLCISAVSKILK